VSLNNNPPIYTSHVQEIQSRKSHHKKGLVEALSSRSSTKKKKNLKIKFFSICGDVNKNFGELTAQKLFELFDIIKNIIPRDIFPTLKIFSMYIMYIVQKFGCCLDDIK
jgi:hypothetical protein